MSDLDNPTIAILLATYNGEQYLMEQLESISQQTHHNWVLIASDDGSNDSTLNLLDEFSRNHPEKITVIKRPDGTRGPCANFFFLMRLCCGKYPYYAFCDQDDYWLPDKLANELDAIRKIENGDSSIPCLTFTDAEVVDEHLKRISESFFSFTGVDPKRTKLSHLLVQNPISGAGIIVNDALLEMALKNFSIDGVAMHDQWLGLVAATFGRISFIDKATYLYRQHGNNSMGAIEMSCKSIIQKSRRAKNSLDEKSNQLSRYLDVFSDDLNRDDEMMVKGFTSRKDLSKMSRILFCLKNDIAMNGLLRNIGLFMNI